MVQELFPEIGYSIVIPGRGIPKWPWHENMGASVSATLPPHWLDNNFLGVALCAVFALEEGETIQQPGEIRCNFECREGPYFSHSITWTHSGDRVVETDHVCMMYQPRTQFVKSKSTHASVFKHIKVSFSLSGASHEVKKSAIRLMYAPNTSGNKRKFLAAPNTDIDFRDTRILKKKKSERRSIVLVPLIAHYL